MTGVVVVGTGFGCFTHVRALRMAGFDVQAVVGRDHAKTERRARAFEVPHAHTSIEDALKLPGVEAVTIATPPGTHAELARAVIEAGRHVLCEKPLALDATEAEAMLELAERAGVVHLLGTEFRFDTGQALLARGVRGGLVGEPRLATFLLHVPSLVDADAELPAWWVDQAQGGGWLRAHGSQVIDQIRVTLGAFESVAAALLDVTEHGNVDDTFVVQFRMRSGALGVMQSTCADRGPLAIESRVIGSRGTMWIEGFGDRVWLADADGQRQLPVPDDLRTAPASAPPPATLETTYEKMIGHGLDLGPYARLAEHFRARIEHAEPPDGPEPATFRDGVADMAVLDAILRSDAERRAVAVDSPGWPIRPSAPR